MEQALCTIASNTEAMPGVWLMWIEAPGIARSVQPGQFITVRCGDLTLRRPLSVHQSRFDRDSGEGEIAILFKVTGKGTLWLSRRQAGETIDVLGPLGNGFALPPIATRQEAREQPEHLLLVAGGIGIAPLVLLAQRASSAHDITVLHGASTSVQLYPFSSLPLTIHASPSKGEGKGEGEERSKASSLPSGVQFAPITEDGSTGRKGMVTDILPDFLDWADHVYASGPLAMYESMADLICHSEGAERPKNLAHDKVREESKLGKCQVSLEVRMGCGFGACYGCTVNTRKGLKRVCRDGPVFELDDIIWQEVRI